MSTKIQKYNLPYVAILVIAILHAVGSFGLLSQYSHYFVPLTALNLFICFLLILPFKESKTGKVVAFFVASFSFGMLLEIIGVNTEFPFGAYYYTNLLAPSIFSVPLIIGVNWFILSYGIISFLNIQVKHLNLVSKSVLAAILMTSIDVLIEPFAIRYNLWVWGSNSVPIANYLAWFAISFCLFLIGFSLLKNEKNIVAIFTIVIFIMFFTLNNLMNSLLG